jgi:RNA polymerase sigma-70 factor, ECF subfamily
MTRAGSRALNGPWPERTTTTVAQQHDGEAVPVYTHDELVTLDDRALVAACQAGRREAFDELVVRHRRAVYQLCYRFVGNHEDATDLAQDAFLRAYRALPAFKGEAAVTTWLHRIAVNLCLNKLAARPVRREPLDELRLPSREPDAMHRLVRAERARDVRSAIAQLPPKQRATLILRVYQELSHQEIASVLGSSVGAVKANVFHALRHLKRILRDEPT